MFVSCGEILPWCAKIHLSSHKSLSNPWSASFDFQSRKGLACSKSRTHSCVNTLKVGVAAGGVFRSSQFKELLVWLCKWSGRKRTLPGTAEQREVGAVLIIELIWMNNDDSHTIRLAVYIVQIGCYFILFPFARNCTTVLRLFLLWCAFFFAASAGHEAAIGIRFGSIWWKQRMILEFEKKGKAFILALACLLVDR